MRTSLEEEPCSVEGGGSFVEDVLDAIAEAVVITHEGRVLHVNRAFTGLFGYSIAEAMGSDLDQLVLPDGRLYESEMILHTLERSGASAIDTVRRGRTGELLDVSVTVARVRLGGEAFGLLVTYRDIRRQKQQEARLQHTAMHDALTGLANRALFLNRVQLTMARLRRRPDRRFAVIFLDLDGFKLVNDTLGHAAGDELLLRVSKRLLSCVRPQDTVARFGGDEFALLVDESGDACTAEGVAERIQMEINGESLLPDEDLQVSASMGIALATTEYATAEALLTDADAAMYLAKAAGKAQHITFRRYPSPAVP